MDNDIQYAGLKILNDAEKAKMKTIITKEYEKLSSVCPEGLQLRVHVKTYDNTGNRKRYVLHMKALTPKGVVNLDSSEERISEHAHWDIAEATHKAMKYMDKEMKRIYNPMGHGWKDKFLKALRKP